MPQSGEAIFNLNCSPPAPAASSLSKALFLRHRVGWGKPVVIKQLFAAACIPADGLRSQQRSQTPGVGMILSPIGGIKSGLKGRLPTDGA